MSTHRGRIQQGHAGALPRASQWRCSRSVDMGFGGRSPQFGHRRIPRRPWLRSLRSEQSITHTVALVLGGFRLGMRPGFRSGPPLVLSDRMRGQGLESGPPQEWSSVGAGGGKWVPGRAGRVRAPWWGAGGRAGVQAGKEGDVQRNGVTPLSTHRGRSQQGRVRPGHCRGLRSGVAPPCPPTGAGSSRVTPGHGRGLRSGVVVAARPLPRSARGS